jgi:hypothetical protein
MNVVLPPREMTTDDATASVATNASTSWRVEGPNSALD